MRIKSTHLAFKYYVQIHKLIIIIVKLTKKHIMQKKYLQITFFLLVFFCFSNISHAQWQQLGTDIFGDPAYLYFGRAMNLSPDGKTLAAGSQSDLFVSFVRLYKEDMGTWQPLGNDIYADDGDNSDAIALSADGERVAIGSIRNGETGGQANHDGHIRIFDLVGSEWQQVGSDIVGTGGENAGSALGFSFDGTTLVVGAHFNDENGIDAGQVRVYKEITGNWQQVGGSINGDTILDNFGFAVDINSDGSIIAIGAPSNNNSRGQVKIYQNVNNNWEQMGNDITGTDIDDIFGRSVSINSDGTIIAIAAIQEIAVSVGYVKIYKYDGSDWQQVGNSILGTEINGFFGNSLSLSANGEIVAIGGSKNQGEQPGSGDVRIYKNSNEVWTQIDQDIDGEVSEDHFGGTVCLSSDGSRVAVSAFLNDYNGYQTGYVQVYENGNIIGISDFSSFNISIYPNPSKGTFYLKNAKSFHLKVTDMDGKLIYNSMINDNLYEFHMNNKLTSGMYFIHLQSATQQFVVKHIVE